MNPYDESKISVIDPFYHPPDPVPGRDSGQNYGNNGIIENITAFNVGAGNNAFYVDQQGIWLGNKKFAKAPFSVDMLGKATFQDELGQTIIDPAGLKSDTQFLSSSIEDFTDRTTTLATAQDIAFTELDFAIRRTTNVFLACSVSGYISGLSAGLAGASPTGYVQLKVDGSLLPFKLKMQNMRMYTPETTGGTTTGLDSKSYQKLLQVAPGDHVISLVMFLDAASGYTLHITDSSVTYITLGK